MRARSVSLLLMHYEPGTHEEVTRWHEEVHRREMHASVPHMYHSQDWLAPPPYVEARPQNELSARGGEYVTLYFSDGDATQLNADIRTYADQTRGNYHPYQEVVWRGRMDITHAQARDGWALTTDTVPLFANVGLLVRIDELSETDSADYQRWAQESYIPALMRSSSISGVFQMRPIGAEGDRLRVHLGFIERGDALEAFQLLKNPAFDTATPMSRNVFLGMYVPVSVANYATYT